MFNQDNFVEMPLKRADFWKNSHENPSFVPKTSGMNQWSCKTIINKKVLLERLAISDYIPASNYLSKVNKKNIRTRCKICPKLTIKTPERCQWRHYGVFAVNFSSIVNEAIKTLFCLFIFLRKGFAAQKA